MTVPENQGFAELVGKDLSGVVFVRDYLQLQFNPPLLLNAYTPVSVRDGDRTATFGEETFANSLIAQVNKVVWAVEVRPNEELEIFFEDGSTVAVSLRPEHYAEPEAVNLYCTDDGLVVI